MKKNIKVSVITPIYNHNIKYVKKCLESLKHQTLKQIEFLLIDNGANEESKRLIAKFARKDDRFRIISLEKNQGYGKAINTGINNAKGEYIGILESDDWADKNMYSELYKLTIDKDIDIVKSDYKSYFSKYKTRLKKNFKPEFCNRELTPIDYPDLFLSDPAIWSAIYKKDFIVENNLYLSESLTARYQDTSFNFMAFAKADKVYFTEKAYINYRRNNPNSSVKDLSSVFSICEEYHFIEHFLDSNPTIKEKLKYVKSYIKFRGYKWNYYRIAHNIRNKFYRIFLEEFQEAYKNKELDRHYFTDAADIEFLETTLGIENLSFYNNDYLNICFVFDKKYVNPACVAISSLLNCANNNTFYNIFCIVSDDVDETEKDKLRKVVNKGSKFSNLAFIKQNNVFKHAYETRGITNSAYYRLLLHNILPDTDIVIYSDVDVIFNSDLSDIKECGIEKYTIGAVKDIAVNLKDNWKMLSDKFHYWTAYFPDKFPNYRNTGFMVMNLKNIRLMNINKQVLELSQKNFNYQDQDIMNIVFPEETILHLSPKYISMPKHIQIGNYKKAIQEHVISDEEYNDVINNPAIYHFPGVKPWDNPKDKYNSIWWNYVKKDKFLQNLFNKKTNMATHINKFLKNETLYDNGVNKTKFFGGFLKVKSNNIMGEYYICGIRLFKKRHHEYKKSMKNLNEQILFRRELANLYPLIQSQSVHPRIFGQYKGAFRDKDVYLVATGPTANYFIPKNTDNEVYVGVNGACRLNRFNLDFLFMQDNTVNQKNNETLTLEVLNYTGNNCQKFFAVYPPNIFIRNINSSHQLLPVPNQYSYKENCHKYILGSPLESEFIPQDIEISPIANLEGTTFSALQFILHGNPKRIFLVGCDCSAGYAYGGDNYIDLSPQKKSWLRMENFIQLHYPDTEVISINPVGLKGMFKDTYTKQYTLENNIIVGEDEIFEQRYEQTVR